MIMSANHITNFFIPGIPKGKGRPRTRVCGKYAQIYTPKETREYEGNIFAFASHFAREHNILMCEGPMRMQLAFYMPRPKSHTKKQREQLVHVSKPDLDNLIKSVTDALSGVFFADDRQICMETSMKVYADGGQQPGIEVTIEAL